MCVGSLRVIFSEGHLPPSHPSQFDMGFKLLPLTKCRCTSMGYTRRDDDTGAERENRAGVDYTARGGPETRRTQAFSQKAILRGKWEKQGIDAVERRQEVKQLHRQWECGGPITALAFV